MPELPELLEIFGLSVHPLELIVRGTLMYWFLFLLFRFVIRRDVGSIAIADMLLLVLIADASQNAMAGGYKTLPDGMILVGTIAAWNYLFDWLSFRHPGVRRFLQAKPLLLIKDGKVQRRALRKEMISHDELMAALRANGIDKLDKVKLAVMESDGEITVVPNDA